MTCTKPGVERQEIVGKMIYTPSTCVMYGGRWKDGECYHAP